MIEPYDIDDDEIASLVPWAPPHAFDRYAWAKDFANSKEFQSLFREAQAHMLREAAARIFAAKDNSDDPLTVLGISDWLWDQANNIKDASA